MQSLLILGRQPALGLAELESLYGAAAVRSVGTRTGSQATQSDTSAARPNSGGAAAGGAVLDVDPLQIDFDRLGGCTKLSKVLTILDTTDWNTVQKYLIKVAPDHASLLPPGKLTIGISVYGLKSTPSAIQATGLTLKKVIRAAGRPVRLVPNKEPELNTAQVLHNHLTEGNAWEILLVRDGMQTIVAQTVRAQDIESYTVRDRERPKRDTRVGMLPPKLAQLLINLAVGALPRQKVSQIDYIDEMDGSKKPDTKDGEIIGDHSGVTILDPFCGTGVVLQEAILMRYKAYGSDIDQRMVDYSRTNIEWLSKSFDLGDFSITIEKGDATTHQWTLPFSHVASETYLGRPFTSRPSPEVLNQTISECNVIIKKFLKNIGKQIPAGTRLCLAIPAWQVRSGEFKHLPILSGSTLETPKTKGLPPKAGAESAAVHLDQIRDMGYNRISFEHVRAGELLYYRPDQVVARELLVIEKV